MCVARKAEDLDYPITPEWLASVRAALTERGAQAKLAREIGCSPGTLNELLKEGKRSHLVPKISKALGIPTPLVVSRDTQEAVGIVARMSDREKRILRGIKSLDKQQQDAAIAVIEQMAKSRG